MKTIIVIECDEDNEITQHLDVIRKQLKKEILKRRKKNDESDFDVSDANCYGEHRASVIYDDEKIVDVNGIYFY